VGLRGSASHVGECVVVWAWCVVCPPVAVTGAKAVFGSLELCGWSCALWCVGSGAGSFEGGQILASVVEGVVWGAVWAVSVVLRGR